MTTHTKRTKRILAPLLIAVLLMAQVFVGVFSAPGYASAQVFPGDALGLAINATQVGVQAAIAADSAVAGGSAGTAAAETVNKTADNLVKPAFRVVARGILLNLLSFVADRLAYDAAVALASAGVGQTGLIEDRPAEEYWKEFGLDIAGEAIESLNDVVAEGTNLDFNICTPASPAVKLSLQVGLRNAYEIGSASSRRQPRCNFNKFVENWQGVISSFSDLEDPSQAILQQFADSYNPGRSELGAAISLNVQVRHRVAASASAQSQAVLEEGRFKDVVDRITGKVTTPAEFVVETSKERLIRQEDRTREQQLSIINEDKEAFEQMALSAVGIFLNTLLSNLGDNIYAGLFDPSPDIDPFNPFASSAGGRERAQDEFRSILSAPIITLNNFNILGEFATCPGGTYRNQNNCVIDQNFLGAINRAQAGAPLTIAQAIEDGALNKNWPLIGPNDPRNEDPNCYRQGFCYGTLPSFARRAYCLLGGSWLPKLHQ